MEVDLCGHATLAAAHILWEAGVLPPGSGAEFHTKSGPLKARKREDGLILLDFPPEPPRETLPPSGLLEAMGITEALYCGRDRSNYLLEVASSEILTSLQPDFRRVKDIHSQGIIATSAGKPPYDFLSRFFDPGEGIDEDPVTGSAHCCLGPFWKNRLQRDELTAYQASRRGGILHLQVGKDRVCIGGHAVTILLGEFLC